MLPHARGNPVLSAVSIPSVEEETETAEVSGLGSDSEQVTEQGPEPMKAICLLQTASGPVGERAKAPHI